MMVGNLDYTINTVLCNIYRQSQHLSGITTTKDKKRDNIRTNPHLLFAQLLKAHFLLYQTPRWQLTACYTLTEFYLLKLKFYSNF